MSVHVCVESLVLLEPWSGIAYKIKCVVYVPIIYLVRLDTPYPDPPGPKRGARWGSGASAMHFGGKFITQTLLGTPNLVWVGLLIGPQIRIWKDLFQGEFITSKL